MSRKVANRHEVSMAAALAPFGWTCAPGFWERYYSDPWVFNLANAVQALTERLSAAGVEGGEAQQ